MGVPAHDVRDHRFAVAHAIPFSSVVAPAAPSAGAAAVMPQAYGAVYEDEGTLINSGKYDGLSSVAARTAMLHDLQTRGAARAHSQYRLRDWLVSRQRFWGTPIPIIHCTACGAVPVPETDLPVRLPQDLPLTGRGGSPLASSHPAAVAWRNVKCPSCHGPATRDTDTLDTFVDSSWYFLRYLDPHNSKELCSAAALQRYWPVRAYVGGIEHAILHLLYARFFCKALVDKGILGAALKVQDQQAVTTLSSASAASQPLHPPSEPFVELITQGMVHGETFKDPDTGAYVKPEHVRLEKRFLRSEKEFSADRESTGSEGKEVAVPVHAETGKVLSVVWEKMSKSKYNGVDPTEMMNRFGADTTRLFVLFKAPVEKVLDWDTKAVQGQARWLGRVWQGVQQHVHRHAPDSPVQAVRAPTVAATSEEQLRREVQQIIAQTSQCLDDRQFNVAVAGLMKLSNAIFAADQTAQDSLVYHEALCVLVLLLAPMAPHITAELWEHLSALPIHSLTRWSLRGSAAIARNVHAQPWPEPSVVAAFPGQHPSATEAGTGADSNAQHIQLQLMINAQFRLSLPVPKHVVLGGEPSCTSEAAAARIMRYLHSQEDGAIVLAKWVGSVPVERMVLSIKGTSKGAKPVVSSLTQAILLNVVLRKPSLS